MTPALKRRWFRWSLRTMLVVIALVALMLGSGLALRARADRLVKRASWHDEEASRFSFSAKLQQIGGLGFPEFKEREEARQRAEQAIADDHKSMAAKCRRAIWRPWIQLEEPPVTGQPAIRIDP
jgi:hypothetical protein